MSSVDDVNASRVLTRALKAAIRYGACGVVEKPVNLPMLCVRMRILIDRFSRAEDTYARISGPGPASRGAG